MKNSKKNVALTAPLLPAIVELAERIRVQGKTTRLPASADMPAVEVVKLDGTRVAGDRTLQYAVLRSNLARAWLKVFVTLDDLATDRAVTTNPAAVEFVEVVRELARSATLADNAADALLPVDTLLPMGAAHLPFIGKGRGKGSMKKLLEKVITKQRIDLTSGELWEACKTHPAARKLGVEFFGDQCWSDGHEVTRAYFDRELVYKVRRAKRQAMRRATE
jgi:hypothetical protein